MIRFGRRIGFGERLALEMDMFTNSYQPNHEPHRERFPVDVPLFIMTRRRIIEAQTREMSSRDVHFVVDEDKSTQIGSAFELMLQLPTPIARVHGCLLRCHCRLVRKEEVSGKPTSMFARIDSYDILRGGYPHQDTDGQAVGETPAVC